MSGRDGVADRLGRALGGTVTSIRRLSGGASRVTSAVDLRARDGVDRALILQQRRGDGLTPGTGVAMETALLREAGRVGAPVPQVVAAGEADGLDAGWLVVERLEGESIARRILRDDAYGAARRHLTGEVADALARIHTIAPSDVADLPTADPLRRPLEFLDHTGEVRPVLELAARWLESNRPEPCGRTVVHGDYRMGNFLVDGSGLRGVLDWELAHVGDPAEDIGWLTAPPWRFGGDGEVGGFGRLDEFLDAYVRSGGVGVQPETVRWWQAYATLKWAVICALQAAAHLGGAVRSVELAAIGRRVCESEWDLLDLMGVTAAEARPSPVARPGVVPPFGRPTAAELVEAVEGYIRDTVLPSADGAAGFDALVAANVLAVVGREFALGPSAGAAHHDRIGRLGFADDAVLAAAIRRGDCDARLDEIGSVLADSVLDEVRVANPAHLTGPGSAGGSDGV
jgi:aminoglycoside phosphotransferase (APT) family kinase protein